MVQKRPKPADVDRTIARGGAVKPEKKELVGVYLRLPPDLLERVDAAVAARSIPTTRTYWILEALAEKLEREGGE